MGRQTWIRHLKATKTKSDPHTPYTTIQKIASATYAGKRKGGNSWSSRKKPAPARPATPDNHVKVREAFPGVAVIISGTKDAVISEQTRADTAAWIAGLGVHNIDLRYHKTNKTVSKMIARFNKPTNQVGRRIGTVQWEGAPLAIDDAFDAFIDTAPSYRQFV